LENEKDANDKVDLEKTMEQEFKMMQKGVKEKKKVINDFIDDLKKVLLPHVNMSMTGQSDKDFTSDVQAYGSFVNGLFDGFSSDLDLTLIILPTKSNPNIP
jgi:hypothetical protein